MRILIVDDDAISLELLKHALRQDGHEVSSASDGQEALDILERGEHRVVISDWEMPGMDGISLCRAIRAGHWSGYIYTILLTAHRDSGDVIAGLSAGADEFMTKPFNPAELRVRVRTAQRIISLETREVAIFALAKLAESRDPETGMHLERMRNYSRILAQTLLKQGKFPEKINQDYVQNIYLTSPLHDIGKVAVPDCVLLKPGRLSDEEFDIMKTHAATGAETLAAAVRQYPGVAYLQMACDIALTHHERFNGKGYPNGLAGEEIPLCGRIVALADVYDALTSKRVYKKAIAHPVARSMIVEESGQHFDPVIVEAFLAAEQEFNDTRTRFDEAIAAAPNPPVLAAVGH
ncbi:MAG TPA: response regulator [Phycisphaerae bacterium]|nr:response regulator [Phycisphaerales bacterium]HRX87731.1 response regulator [Phycisphaerae bacterium]